MTFNSKPEDGPRSIINIMYFFSFLHFPFDTPSLMEIPFSMLLYGGRAERWSLHPRDGHGGFGGRSGWSKKRLLKRLPPATAVCVRAGKKAH